MNMMWYSKMLRSISFVWILSIVLLGFFWWILNWNDNVYFLCKRDGSGGVSESFKVSQRLFGDKTFHLGSVSFRVSSVSGLIYNAEEIAPTGFKQATSLEFDSVSGRLLVVDRRSSGALLILGDMCSKRIDENECTLRMQTIPQGNVFDCFDGGSLCESIEAGYGNITSRYLKCISVNVPVLSRW
jgi:hypothetical protein